MILKHPLNNKVLMIKKGLNITLVPANMARLSFGPCKKKNSKSILAKNLFFKMVLETHFLDD